MPDGEDSIVSAQVVLRSATGRQIEHGVLISGKNLDEYTPSTDTISAAAALFRTAGFEVGPVVGISFSVTGTQRTFEDYFGMRVELADDRAWEFVSREKPIGHELSAGELPEALQPHVHVVTFPLPPDFGPTEF